MASSITGGFAPARPARPTPPAADANRGAQVLGWSALAGIGTSLLIIITISAVRHSWAVAPMPGPAPYAPPLLNASLSPLTVTLGLWAAGLLAAGGVLAGLAAVARGARLPLWLMIGGAVVAVAALTVLPPTGSTDTLDYAAYGRMVVLGHTPYVMTPDQLRSMGDPIGQAAPHLWGTRVSLYGPLATVEEAAAALLGGTSVARIIFWLKLWNALAFGAVALALDRMLRADRARRTRAHLLWTVNPLLLWNLIAGGHLDGLAAAVGFLGLALFSSPRTDGDPGSLRAASAGLLIGMAADLKISFALFGLGLIWASRRSLKTALTGAVSALVVIVPSYIWFGPPAVAALLSRTGNDSAVSFYRLLSWLPDNNQLILFLALPALAFVTAAMLARFPDHAPGLPAIQPALALGLAWLFIWPYQYPWYDAMVICLLALYPASRLDWLVIGRLGAATIALMPGNPVWPRPDWLTEIAQATLFYITPGLMLAAAAVLVWLCLTGAWRIQPPGLARQPELLSLT
ncbi:MAG: hypothetical protein ABSB01_19580 [Streptosporangiaceae bacterium]